VQLRSERVPDLEVGVVDTLEEGVRLVRLSSEAKLQEAGVVPLPPYVHEPLKDPERYQTVFARSPGSVAATTAALHFTPELLDKLRTRGVSTAFCTLHVGLDTFRPVKTGDPLEHKMYTEFFSVGRETVDEVNAALKEGRRVIAVGTTVVRTLEQVALRADQAGMKGLVPMSGWADLYILPGHRFRVVKAMITNFHLPRSTLLMLVCAFASQELVFKAYHEAIEKQYRFYSFGDAMMVL
jgi:S-adenosylmethionine:tRNA ribosyltransferase-isomerase